MAVFIFVPADFKAAYPEFNTVPDATLTRYFNNAQYSFLDNTDASIVLDIGERGYLFDLLVAHQAQLASNPGQPPGRLASFAEGSVSGSYEWTGKPQAQGAAWYLQTEYGATYWQATARYRRARMYATFPGKIWGSI